MPLPLYVALYTGMVISRSASRFAPFITVTHPSSSALKRRRRPMCPRRLRRNAKYCVFLLPSPLSSSAPSSGTISSKLSTIPSDRTCFRALCLVALRLPKRSAILPDLISLSGATSLTRFGFLGADTGTRRSSSIMRRCSAS